MPKPTKAASRPKAPRSTPYPPVNTSTTMATGSAVDSLPTPASGEAQSKPWIPEDDAKLLRARQQGLNWNPIAAQYFPTKTANACRKRHERLLIKKNGTGDWDSAKIEALARSYMELREQMWKILAAKLGEKWEIVERKCMEKGLKTLRSHGRSANRKHKRGNQEDDYDDDMDDTDFHDSGLGPELNPGDQIPKDLQNRYSVAGQHDQQPPFSGGVSGAPSVYSGGFSSCGLSSAPSYGTASVASSTSNTNTPGTLPSIASLFEGTPVTRY